MIGIVGCHDAIYTRVDAQVFGEAWPALTMSVNIFPTGGANNRDLIRRNANYVIGIVLMEAKKPLGETPIPQAGCDGNFGRCSESWPGDVGEGM